MKSMLMVPFWGLMMLVSVFVACGDGKNTETNGGTESETETEAETEECLRPIHKVDETKALPVLRASYKTTILLVVLFDQGHYSKLASGDFFVKLTVRFIENPVDEIVFCVCLNGARVASAKIGASVVCETEPVIKFFEGVSQFEANIDNIDIGMIDEAK